MTDYIAREAAKKKHCEICMEECICYRNKSTCDELKAFDLIHAADVRPVVRGRWIKARGSWCTPGGDPVWECSECGKGVHVYGIEHGTYGSDVSDGQWVACPNCGARMEES